MLHIIPRRLTPVTHVLFEYNCTGLTHNACDVIAAVFPTSFYSTGTSSNCHYSISVQKDRKYQEENVSRLQTVRWFWEWQALRFDLGCHHRTLSCFCSIYPVYGICQRIKQQIAYLSVYLKQNLLKINRYLDNLNNSALNKLFLHKVKKNNLFRIVVKRVIDQHVKN